MRDCAGTGKAAILLQRMGGSFGAPREAASLPQEASGLFPVPRTPATP
jgi:hypothetical protein